MALSLRDEIEALLQHSLEQTSVYQQRNVSGGLTTADAAIQALGDLVAAQGKAILRLADEVDTLRDTA